MKDLEVTMLRASDPTIQARLPQPPGYSVSEPMGPQPPNVQDAILPRPGHLTMDAGSGEEVDISIVQEHDQATREVTAGWRLRNSRDAETSNSVLPAQSSSTQILYEKNLAPRCGNTGPENDIDLWSLPPLHNCDWTDLDLWDLDLWSIPLTPSMPSPRILPQYDKTIQTRGYRDPTTEFAAPTDG